MNLHTRTPNLRVSDPRTLIVRDISYCRSEGTGIANERITRHTWNLAGHTAADWDPRLWEKAATANSRKIPSLSGQTLLDESVDAGWRLELSGADRQSVERWDGRGSYSRTDSDEYLRPVSVTESAINAQPNVVERYTYGDASVLSAEHNQCGRLIRHDDPAGTLYAQAFGLAGGVLIENRRFLQTEEQPDWPLDSGQRDALLEPGEGHTTTTVFDAVAAPIVQTDAVGNRTEHLYTVGGFPRETRLKLTDAENAQTLVSDLRYNPTGQLERERLGNGVVSEKTYEPATGRLTRIFSSRADNTVLQDLNYRYDPVGNIVEIEDAAQATRFFANQRIEPVRRYRYDTLYQLIEATGREVSTGTSHGPALPTRQNLPQDPNQLSNYTQRYDYDAGGNLLEMRHVGAQSFTRTMLVAPDCNRSLPEGDVDPGFDKGFDANGNLQQSIRGQDLTWDLRNQLRSASAVERENGSNDEERYVYDSSGQRCRKIRSALAKSQTLVGEVRYLPGLELRTEASGETLQVSVIQTGGNDVRVLHWPNGKPEGIANNQIRYSLSDHLGSSALELDHKADLISLEGYYPFGGTAYWAARKTVEAKYKIVRYSGKERDATGLYYYGLRYYAPWLNRWINPDPRGTADGLNQFAFVMNNPINIMDLTGGEGMTPDEAARVITHAIRMKSYKNNALREARTMYDEGTFFTEFREFSEGSAPDSLEGLMETNISNLREAVNPRSADEEQFYQRYQTSDFHVTHATDHPDVLDQTQRLTLRSRSWLEDNNKAVNGLSFDDDFKQFRNFGYVFFALEAGPTLVDRHNSYGKTVFRIPFDKDFESAHMVLVDQLIPTLPPAFPLNLSSKGSRTLDERNFSGSLPFQMFAGAQAKEALALAIIDQARWLPPSDRAKILTMSTPGEMHLLTNTLFKPEIRFPRHFTTQKAKRYNT